MVRIVSHEELSYHGISPAEIQKSLEIQCFKKKFQRKSDLPKKFKEKAIYVCTTIMEMGLESFITETNYSYTVWEESQIQKEEIKPNKVPITLNNNKSIQTENRTDKEDKFTNKISQHLKETKITHFSDSFKEINDIEILEGNIDDDTDDNDYTYISDFSSLSNQVNLSQQHQKMDRIDQNEISIITQPMKKYRGVAITSSNDELANVRKKRQKTYRGITY
jgi:hypothetical protein